MSKRYLPNSTGCFVCGEENPAGLRVRFFVEDGQVKTPLNATARHCGYPGRVHGGILAAALDECMGWAAARAIGRMCVTGELTTRYLHPVTLDRPFLVTAEVVRPNRRLVHCKGAIVDAGGAVHVRAEGKFFPLPAEETLAVDDLLLYRGGEERVFDALRGAAGAGPDQV